MLEITDKKSQCNKFLLQVGLMLLVAIVGLILINNKMTQAAKTIQNQASQLQAIKNREENINKLQENYQKIKGNIATVTSILPDEENVASFVQYLENLAKKYSVNIEILFDDKLNAQIDQNKYLTVKLNLSGSGDAVKKAWASLEKGPYFINISSINLLTSDGLGSDSQLKLTVKVFTNDPYKITQ